MTEPVRIEQVSWQQANESLLEVRFRVFVDEQGVPPSLEEDEHDPHALHLLALDKTGQAVACARMFYQGDTALVGRMAVLKPFRGRNIGTRLLRELLKQARLRRASKVQLHAQCSAEPFYRRQGFIPVGPVFEEAGIPHQKMVNELLEPGGS